MAKRSRLSSERKARRAAANVRRWGMGSPGPGAAKTSVAPPAAGRQKSRRLGRSGPALLERSPTPPPPSPFLHHFLIDVRGGAVPDLERLRLPWRPRLRDGAGFVTCPQPIGADEKFADPSASVTRFACVLSLRQSRLRSCVGCGRYGCSVTSIVTGSALTLLTAPVPTRPVARIVTGPRPSTSAGTSIVASPPLVRPRTRPNA